MRQHLRRRVSLIVITAALAFSVSRVPAQERPLVEGFWSTAFTAPNHPEWKIEDYFCQLCPASANEHLKKLLADPANDNRPLAQLGQEATRINNEHRASLMTDAARARLKQNDLAANDAIIRCEPPDLITLLRAPPPIAITVHADRIIIHHEHWNTVRTITLGNPDAPTTGRPTRLGTATARFDKTTLVVESRNLLGATTGGITTADGAAVIERWTPSGARLNLELTINDPASYREPLVLYASRVRTADEKIFDLPPCEAISGQL